MNTLLYILLLFHIDTPVASRNIYFEKVELNHFHDENARWVFDQIIWYDENDNIQAWRLAKDPRGSREEDREAKKKWDNEQEKLPLGKRSPFIPPFLGISTIFPVYDIERKMYRSIVYEYELDGSGVKVVYARIKVETWTQYDPELYGREKFPKDLRRDLRK